MMRYLSGCLLGVLVLITHPLACAASAEMAEKDAVKAILQKIVDAWNRHDMDAFSNLFSEDADFVNVRGTRWIGRDAIRKAHAAAHAAIFKDSQLSVVGEASVRFLKPDVAVERSITEVKNATDTAGHTLPPRDTMLTLMMMKMAGNWTIVVAQNTNIDGDAPPIKLQGH
jgi:uncharacterized protein (TIGR02246 family)